MQNNKKLTIGAARVKIDIPADFFPYTSFRGRYYTGQHDDIYVRCILVDNTQERALIVSMEIGDLGDIDVWLDRVGREADVPTGNIFLTVTHNHESPHVSDSHNQHVGDVEKTELFGELVWNATQKAIQVAKENMKPGRVGYGTGECDMNVNRDLIVGSRSIMAPNSRGIVDKTVAVIKFEDLDGKPLAFFINYPVHACVMFDVAIKDGGMFVTGDLPGETSKYIEERYGNDVVALWTSGAAADLNPKFMAKQPTFDSDGNFVRHNAGEGGYLLVRLQAEYLANEVLNISEEIDRTSATPVIKGIQRKYMVPGQKKTEDPFNVSVDHRYKDGNPVELHLSVLLLHNIALVGVPGEPVCSIGMKVKEALPFRNGIVVAHCNGSMSYMSDEFGFENRTFEAVVSHVKRGVAEEVLVDYPLELIDELLSNDC